MTLESFEIIRVLALTAVGAIVAFALQPGLFKLLQAFNLSKSIRPSAIAPIFAKLHSKKAGTPTMGGVLVWGTVLILALFFLLAAKIDPNGYLAHFNFLSRSEVLLPLGALIASALVGLVDDYFNVRGIGPKGGGLRMRHRLGIYTVIAIAGAWWFRFKLDWDLLHIPFVGDFNIGWWYVPIFIFVIVATAFSVNEADGLDGLAGGTLLTSFAAFAIIAFAQGRYDLATFCGVVIGGLLTFLWFNIFPAKFFMGDTGAMSLGVTLGVIAMLTNSVFLLPVIGLVFVLESLSVLLQVFWRKAFKRKLLHCAPFHHHLEEKKWPEPQIVMRLWVISILFAAVGAALSLLDALV